MSPASGPRCPSCDRPYQIGRDKCMWCGYDLSSIKVSGLTFSCPLCKEENLIEQQSEHWNLYACKKCRGIWMPSGMLEKLEALHEDVEPPTRSQQLAQQKKNESERVIDTNLVYKHCPQCGDLMQRKQYQRMSKVVIDSCLGHGVWFDAGEFRQVVAFLSAGGMKLSAKYGAEQKAAQERMTEQMSFLQRLTGPNINIGYVP